MQHPARNKHTNGAQPLPVDKWVNEEEMRVSRHIFSDPQVYELEVERIFNRCWLFLGHETEISNPSDYVTRYMGDDQVIVIRGEDGIIRAFLNSCLHRGAQVCRADGGNARRFTCPYHAWTYDTEGKLITTSFDQYYDRKDFAKMGLTPVAQLDTYDGLIFATWDPQAPPLHDYLGDMKWYLDLFFRRTPEGMTVLGPPQRWVVETNWKLPALNFGTDTQHALRVHYGPLAIGQSAGAPGVAEMMKIFGESPQVSFPQGHGLILILNPPHFPDYFGFPSELAPLYQRTLNREQLHFFKRMFTSVGTLFPYTSWIQPVLGVAAERPPVGFVSLRSWQPLGPQKIELWSWYFAEKEASAAWKAETLRAGIQTFAMSGTFEEDDAEVWASIVRATKGSMARRQMMDFRAGVSLPPRKDFPGPGTAYSTLFSEPEQFNFLRRWKQLIAQG
ncbi:MAG: aromatic ring-hydroxylating oxygenase subunit alpha [Candidatus Binatia bacterium]